MGSSNNLWLKYDFLYCPIQYGPLGPGFRCHQDLTLPSAQLVDKPRQAIPGFQGVGAPASSGRSVFTVTFRAILVFNGTQAIHGLGLANTTLPNYA